MGDGNGGNEGLKKCANCEEWLPRTKEYYTSDKGKSDGLCSYCRVCAQMRSFLYNRRRGLVRKLLTPAEKLVRRKEAKRRDYVRHQEAYRERSRKWRAENKDAFKVLNTNSRAIRKAAKVVPISTTDLKILMERQNGLCAYCNEPLFEYHIDHIVPISKGGEHVLDNLCLACPRCNRRKKNRDAEEFRKTLLKEQQT